MCLKIFEAYYQSELTDQVVVADPVPVGWMMCQGFAPHMMFTQALFDLDSQELEALEKETLSINTQCRSIASILKVSVTQQHFLKNPQVIQMDLRLTITELYAMDKGFLSDEADSPIATSSTFKCSEAQLRGL
nr:hypothetical protein Iba_chr02fCG14040 [Ipomoea batatas]